MSVTIKDAYYTSSNGFTGIHTRIWFDPECEPKALFQIAHGLNETIRDYDELSRFLADNGYIVFGNDHLGFGDSVFDDEDKGFFGNIDGDKRLVDDIHILSLIMKKRYPGLPLILFGHDLGSFCVRVYAADFSDEVSRIILSGTTEIPSSTTVLQTPVNMLCDRLGPKLILKNQSLTVGGMRDYLSLASSACSTLWSRKISPDLQIMIISGADDKYTFKGRGITALCDNLEDINIEPEVIQYPSFGHDYLKEMDSEIVFTDILKFCEK